MKNAALEGAFLKLQAVIKVATMSANNKIHAGK